jgi:hypothetical protein
MTYDDEETKRTLSRADKELHENLHLFVERMMLFRITRTRQKGAELARFARILVEAGTIGQDRGPVLQEITAFGSLVREELSRSDVANLFSAMVLATENLDAVQLYYLLEKLRTEPIGKAP